MTNYYVEDPENSESPEELKFPLEIHITEVKDRVVLIAGVLLFLIILVVANSNVLTKYLFNLVYS